MIHFISDLHLGHDRDFIYQSRGFNSIEEHDDVIIERWNKVVKPEDYVYVLGDLMLGDNESGIEKFNKLVGTKKIIWGNHDTLTRIDLYQNLKNTFVLGYADIIKYGKYRFYLSHHPTITSNMEKGEPMTRHLINLFGHTHSKDKFYMDMPFMYNVACDAHDCTPVSIEQIIKDINEKSRGV